jgi:hypothetical protein
VVPDADHRAAEQEQLPAREIQVLENRSRKSPPSKRKSRLCGAPEGRGRPAVRPQPAGAPAQRAGASSCPMASMSPASSRPIRLSPCRAWRSPTSGCPRCCATCPTTPLVLQARAGGNRCRQPSLSPKDQRASRPSICASAWCAVPRRRRRGRCRRRRREIAMAKKKAPKSTSPSCKATCSASSRTSIPKDPSLWPPAAHLLCLLIAAVWPFCGSSSSRSMRTS